MARQSRPTLLLTRPDAASQRFAALARARFGAELPVVIAPVLRPVFPEPEAIEEPLAGVIFSSETGVEGFMRLAPRLPMPAWCVGPRTAQAAQAAGFEARAAGGDAQALRALLVAERPEGRLLHARGRETTGNLAADLRRDGLDVGETIVYAQDIEPLSPEAKALLARRSEVLLPIFSPRSAQILTAQLSDGCQAPLLVAALSPAVARLASRLPALRRETAESPDAEGMLDALARLLGAEPKACANPRGD